LIGAVASRGTFSGVGSQPVGLSWAAAGAPAGIVHDAMIASTATHLRKVTSAEAVSGNVV
jgi:hypothetical protein